MIWYISDAQKDITHSYNLFLAPQGVPSSHILDQRHRWKLGIISKL